MRKLTIGTIDGAEYRKPQYISFNPYMVLGTEPKEWTADDLVKDEVFTDQSGAHFKVVGFGSAGHFGKDNQNSPSWIYIKILKLKHPQKNPNRYYFDMSTHNPKEVYHRSPERPEGSKYGGVGFGGWVNSPEECIKKCFPKEHTKKSTGSLYWSKTSNIIRIKMTDYQTGEKTTIEPTAKHNKLLHSL